MGSPPPFERGGEGDDNEDDEGYALFLEAGGSPLVRELGGVLFPPKQTKKSSRLPMADVILASAGPAGPAFELKPGYFHLAGLKGGGSSPPSSSCGGGGGNGDGEGEQARVKFLFFVCRYGREDWGSDFSPDGLPTPGSEGKGNGRWDGRLIPDLSRAFGAGEAAEECRVYESRGYTVREFRKVGGTEYGAFKRMSARICCDYWEAKVAAEEKAERDWGGREKAVIEAAKRQFRNLQTPWLNIYGNRRPAL